MSQNNSVIKANVWLDGVCLSCGWPVIETDGTDLGKDYKNRCTNPHCKEAKWHATFDAEFLEYYKHGWDK